jgi:hypothetical protein
MAGGVQYLATFGASGRVRKHLQPLGVWQGVAPARAPLQLEEKFSFPLIVFRFLPKQVRSEREREFKEGGSRELRGKKALVH